MLVLDLCCALLTGLLVLHSVGLLTVDAAVFDEVAGIAVLELDCTAPLLATIGAGFVANIAIIRHVAHCGIDDAVTAVHFRVWAISTIYLLCRDECILHHILGGVLACRAAIALAIGRGTRMGMAASN